MMRSAVEKVKGTKEGGNLESRHHKATTGSHFHRHHHQRDDDDEDSIELEERQCRQSALISQRGEDDKDRQSIKEDAESIVEPMPGDVRGEQSEAGGSSTCNENEPVLVDHPIVDDEVENFVTEQLYIHSKLMIVDDRIIICGSGKGYFMYYRLWFIFVTCRP
jgi:phosphatidylserine/phosphatidylglycerophosphate/cardiolipin synthase-like enzyme